MSGEKRTDAEEVCNHGVDREGHARALQDGVSVVRPGVWHGHAYFRDCCKECGLVENKGGKIEVIFSDLAL